MLDQKNIQVYTVRIKGSHVFPPTASPQMQPILTLWNKSDFTTFEAEFAKSILCFEHSTKRKLKT